MKRKRVWTGVGGLAAVIATALPAFVLRGYSPIEVSKETTWFTEPLTADGYVNYRRVLRDRDSRGRIPSLLQELQNEEIAVVSNVRDTGTLYRAAKERFKSEATTGLHLAQLSMILGENGDFRNRYRKCCSLPYQRSAAPFIASVVSENEEWYDRLEKAIRSPNDVWFWSDETGNPVGNAHALNHNMFNLWEDDVPVRFMLNLGEGNFAEANQDLDLLRTIANWQLATPSHRAMSRMCRTHRRICKCCCVAMLTSNRDPNEWLPQSSAEIPLSLDSNVLSQIRVVMLDELQAMHQRGPTTVSMQSFDQFADSLKQRSLEMSFDWNVLMRDQNAFLDEVTADIWNERTWPIVHTRFQEKWTQIPKLAQWQSSGNFYSVSNARLSGTEYVKQHRRHLTLTSAYEHVSSLYMKIAWTRLTRIVAQLATYRNTHSKFPDSLRQIEIQTNEELLDPFTESEFKYSRDGDGFRLYSVGANMTDENGTFGYSSGSPGEKSYENADDISFRWPFEDRHAEEVGKSGAN